VALGASGGSQGRRLAENDAIARRILSGEEPAQDIVLVNASAALVAVGLAGSFAEGMAAAARSIDSGAARAKLTSWSIHKISCRERVR